jgi:RNA polymerase sigma factor (sigma-70 family)
MPAPETPEQLLLQHLPFIERIGRNGARRHGLRPEDADEFVSDLKLKLLADDYAVIRKFKGQSSFTTYLTAVVQHYLLDYRNHLWGKWRPSAEAKRLGPTAVLLDRLTVRDGHPLDEAVEMVLVNYRMAATRSELSELAQKLPVREGRPRAVAEDEAGNAVPDPAQRPDERLIEDDEERQRGRIGAAVRQAVQALSPEDRVIVRMRIDDGFTVAEIARVLRLEAKPLYRRIEAIFKALRADLQRHGIDVSVVQDLWGAEAPRGHPWGVPMGKRRIRSV